MELNPAVRQWKMAQLLLALFLFSSSVAMDHHFRTLIVGRPPGFARSARQFDTTQPQPPLVATDSFIPLGLNVPLVSPKAISITMPKEHRGLDTESSLPVPQTTVAAVTEQTLRHDSASPFPPFGPSTPTTQATITEAELVKITEHPTLAEPEVHNIGTADVKINEVESDLPSPFTYGVPPFRQPIHREPIYPPPITYQPGPFFGPSSGGPAAYNDFSPEYPAREIGYPPSLVELGFPGAPRSAYAAVRELNLESQASTTFTRRSFDEPPSPFDLGFPGISNTEDNWNFDFDWNKVGRKKRSAPEARTRYTDNIAVESSSGPSQVRVRPDGDRRARGSADPKQEYEGPYIYTQLFGPPYEVGYIRSPIPSKHVYEDYLQFVRSWSSASRDAVDSHLKSKPEDIGLYKTPSYSSNREPAHAASYNEPSYSSPGSKDSYNEPANSYKEPSYSSPQKEPAYKEPAYTTPAYKEPAYTTPAYKEPAYKEPAYKEPAYKEPAYKEPAYKEPAYKEPAYKEPAYKEPAYKEPAYKEPAYTTPAYKEPAYKEPAYKEPAYTTPAYKEPTYKEPAFTTPAYKEPAYTTPAYKEPAYKEPSYTPPAHKEPAYTTPAYKEPAYKEPSYAAPAYKEPAYAAPAHKESAYKEPSYTTPAYKEPAYKEPAFKEPVYTTPAYKEPAYTTPAYKEPAYTTSAYKEPAYKEPAYNEPAYKEPAKGSSSYTVVVQSPSYLPSKTGVEYHSPKTNYVAPESEFRPMSPKYEAPTDYLPPKKEYVTARPEPTRYESPKYPSSQLYDTSKIEVPKTYDIPPKYDATPAYESSKYDEPAYEPTKKPHVPKYDTPRYEEPKYEAPKYEAPKYEEPKYDSQKYEAPKYEEPKYEAPNYEESKYEAPKYEAPKYEEPKYETPKYEEPKYEAPKYEESKYEAPKYESPKYEEPKYEAPKYESPKYESSQSYESAKFEAPTTYTPPRSNQGKDTYTTPYKDLFPGPPAYTTPSYSKENYPAQTYNEPTTSAYKEAYSAPDYSNKGQSDIYSKDGNDVAISSTSYKTVSQTYETPKETYNAESSSYAAATESYKEETKAYSTSSDKKHFPVIIGRYQVTDSRAFLPRPVDGKEPDIRSVEHLKGPNGQEYVVYYLPYGQPLPVPIRKRRMAHTAAFSRVRRSPLEGRRRRNRRRGHRRANYAVELLPEQVVQLPREHRVLDDTSESVHSEPVVVNSYAPYFITTETEETESVQVADPPASLVNEQQADETPEVLETAEEDSLVENEEESESVPEIENATEITSSDDQGDVVEETPSSIVEEYPADDEVTEIPTTVNDETVSEDEEEAPVVDEEQAVAVPLASVSIVSEEGENVQMPEEQPLSQVDEEVSVVEDEAKEEQVPVDLSPLNVEIVEDEKVGEDDLVDTSVTEEYPDFFAPETPVELVDANDQPANEEKNSEVVGNEGDSEEPASEPVYGENVEPEIVLKVASTPAVNGLAALSPLEENIMVQSEDEPTSPVDPVGEPLEKEPVEVPVIDTSPNTDENSFSDVPVVAPLVSDEAIPTGSEAPLPVGISQVTLVSVDTPVDVGNKAVTPVGSSTPAPYSTKKPSSTGTKKPDVLPGLTQRPISYLKPPGLAEADQSNWNGYSTWWTKLGNKVAKVYNYQ